MAQTNVSHVVLTVSTVEVFIETMRFISENELWDDARNYLEESGKTEIFVDFEAFDKFRKMLKKHRCCDPKDPIVARILGHNDPW